MSMIGGKRWVKQFLLLNLLLGSFSFCQLNAQSRIAVSASKGQTMIKVTNFPKNTTVLIVDENMNLVTVASTSNEGTAEVKMKKRINSALIARTLHGDYEASTKDIPIPKTDSHMAVSSISGAQKA